MAPVGWRAAEATGVWVFLVVVQGDLKDFFLIFNVDESFMLT